MPHKAWPSYLFRARRGANDYLCEFDHEDLERARESVLWHGAWEEQTAQVLAVMDRHGVLRDGLAVLDFGCGVGRVTKAICAAHKVSVLAADRSPQMLLHAARYLKECPEAVLCTDETALRATAVFGAVLAIETFQHIPFTLLPGIVQALVDRLAPGGVLFVYGNEHLDVGHRGLPGTTLVRTVLDTVCNVYHHEVVPRQPGDAPDRHVFLCARRTA